MDFTTIETLPFGTTPEGNASLFVMTNPSGMAISVTNYGGILVSCSVPDRHGEVMDVVLGFETLEEYLGPHPRFGCLIGRYANRIARARFTLDGAEYVIATKRPPNAIHGGVKGFDKHLWAAQEFKSDSSAGVTLSRTSPDGEEGFPGNLDVTVTYSLSRAGVLRIEYLATTDKPTVCNFTNHSYFNLSGEEDVLGHKLMINADHYLPVDDRQIPTGEHRPVAGTPFDFTSPKYVGADIDASDDQIISAGGYDHCYVVRGQAGTLRLAAVLVDPESGRRMETWTTEPGVQLFTANSMKNLSGKNGKTYGKRSGICLETQHFPDSPNQPDFPNTVLRPGQEFKSVTEYRFGNYAD